MNLKMKVKLFVADDLQEIEKMVNEWLETSPVNVQHITQSQSEKNGRFVFVTGIYYTQQKLAAV
jgi:hypothetical protein